MGVQELPVGVQELPVVVQELPVGVEEPSPPETMVHRERTYTALLEAQSSDKTCTSFNADNNLGWRTVGLPWGGSLPAI